MKRFIFLALLLAFVAAPVEASGNGVRSSFFFSTRVVAVPTVAVIQQPLVFQSFAVDPCHSSAAFFSTRSFNAFNVGVNVNSFRSVGFGSRTVIRDRGLFFGNRTVIRSR